MAYTTSSLHDRPDAPTLPDDHSAGNHYRSDDPQHQESATQHPRLIEEHHIIGPHGQDEIEATDERQRSRTHSLSRIRLKATRAALPATLRTINADVQS
ncbi:MAG: hypothetical protein M3Y17_11775, partial [Actinomycetota bacterium]|nr:hypothetical protein [Actinomycetota bacterium]